MSDSCGFFVSFLPEVLFFWLLRFRLNAIKSLVMPPSVVFRPVRILLLAFFVFAYACQRPPAGSGQNGRATARIIQAGLINCFGEGTKNENGSEVYCEASAVAFDGTRLIFGNDKPVPGDSLSSVFLITYQRKDLSRQRTEYLNYPTFKNAIKYEDFATTPDGNYFLATTAFDRIKPSTADFDGYNTLLFWKKGQAGQVSIVSSTQRNGISSSVSLREGLARALALPSFPDGPPYFKIEGLACIPGNRLLFGVREWGENFEKFTYAVKIISVSYQISQDRLTLGKDFSLIYTFDPNPALLYGRTVALSGLEYDADHNQLLLLTSYEQSPDPEGIGAFLWLLPLPALASQQAPTLVLNEQNQPLVLAHKAEGICTIGNNQVFIIHDDDRVLGSAGLMKNGEPFFRKPHQAAYTVLQINQDTN